MVPLDGTPLSEAALSLLPLARSLGFLKVLLASVWEVDGRGGDREHQKELADRGRALLEGYLEQKREQATAAGFDVETHVGVGQAADELIKTATEHDVSLILVATHGRDGITRWRLGSVADKLLRQASCPVLVIGPNVRLDSIQGSGGRVLVPLDGSDLAEKSLAVASSIANQTDSPLDLVRVVSGPLMDLSLGTYPVDVMPAVEDAARTYLEAQAARAGSTTRVHTTLLIGPAREQLLSYSWQDPPSLVVMASHGRAGLPRAIIGSVADGLLHGPAPVLLLRPDETTADWIISV